MRLLFFLLYVGKSMCMHTDLYTYYLYAYIHIQYCVLKYRFKIKLSVIIDGDFFLNFGVDSF